MSENTKKIGKDTRWIVRIIYLFIYSYFNQYSSVY